MREFGLVVAEEDSPGLGVTASREISSDIAIHHLLYIVGRSVHDGSTRQGKANQQANPESYDHHVSSFVLRLDTYRINKK